MLRTINILVFLFVSFSAEAQQISNKQTLNGIMQDVDLVYNGRNIVDDLPKYKHFARWAYWWSSRVDNNGSFSNVELLNRQAVRKVEKDFPNNMRSLNNSWSYIGPNNSSYWNNQTFCKGNGYGRIDRIAFHPSDEDIIYVGGPSGGLWRTEDGGSTWVVLTDHLTNIGVAGIVVSHADPSDLYILSGTADNSPTGGLVTTNGYFLKTSHIYNSEDEGQTWKIIFTFPDSVNQVFRLKQHNSDPDLLIAATTNGLWRSDDGGDTWDLKTNGKFTDIEFHTTSSDTIYASGFGIYKYSYDKGLTWNFGTGINTCNYPDGTPVRCELAVSADDSDDVWLLCGPGRNNINNTNDKYCGLFHSTNHGKDFVLRNNTPDILGRISSGYSDQSNYDLAIDVNPSDQNRVVAGALRIWIHANEGIGNTWTNSASFWENTGSQQNTFPSGYVHPDVHDIEYNSIDNKVYACSDGGVYVSADNGTTWTNISAGIHTAQIYNMDIAPTNSNRIAIGLQDNGIKLRNSSSSQDFKHVYQADGYSVDFDPNNSSTLALSVNAFETIVTSPNYSTSNTIEGTGNSFFRPVRYSESSSDTVFVGESPMLIHKVSSNLSSPSNTILSASWEIHTCSDATNQLYIAGGDSTFRNSINGTLAVSLDRGINFTDQSTSAGFPQNMTKITDIATVPNFCNQVAFSMGGYQDGQKVFYSSTSGNSWANISYNLPNVPVHSLEYESDGTLYAGTEIGVFVKEGNSSNWLPFSNKMPRVPITDLQLSGTKIIASTFGRGVWEAFLYSGSCPIFSLLTTPISGQYFHEASNETTLSGLIDGGSGTDVNIHAGQKIELIPGFKTTLGSKFNAKITGCGTPPN